MWVWNPTAVPIAKAIAKAMANHPSRGIKPGGPKARMNGEFGKLRALAMLKCKIQTGMSNIALGKQFNVAPNTVNRNLQMLRNQGLLQGFEDQLIAELVPNAMVAIKGALANGDAQVALEILKGSGILKKQRADPMSPEEKTDDLTLYIRAKRQRQLPPATQDGTSGDDPSNGQRFVPLSLSAEDGFKSAEESPESVFPPDGIDWVETVAGVADGALGAIEGELANEDDVNGE